MNRKQLKPVNDPAQVPEGLSDEEHLRFWETHSITEEYLDKTEEVPEDERPRPRQWTRPINVRFDDFTLGRLKEMARRRNVGYQTLLKTFVLERLYEEEKREGVLTATVAADEARKPTAPPSTSVGRSTEKPRDWQKEAFAYVKENEELLGDPDIDSISLSRLANDSASRLLELSGEIKKASTRRDFPPVQMRRMMKGYERLKSFTERAIGLYGEKFPDLLEELDEELDEPDAERRPPGSEEQAKLKEALRTANSNVIDARDRFAG